LLLLSPGTHILPGHAVGDQPTAAELSAQFEQYSGAKLVFKATDCR
jgi:hypothetical protein